jgi:hypothetical protein
MHVLNYFFNILADFMTGLLAGFAPHVLLLQTKPCAAFLHLVSCPQNIHFVIFNDPILNIRIQIRI